MTKVDTKPKARFFNMKTPLLADGRLNNYLAETDLMTVTIKVYASGGENALHMHPHEDHSFIVLQGQATFHTETDDNVRVVNKNDGVMLPKGTHYRFESSAPENLVMLRIGAAREHPENWRAFPDGRPFTGETAAEKTANKHKDPVILPGKFFAE